MLNHACTLIVNPRSRGQAAGGGGGVLEKRGGFTERWQYASEYEEISSHLTGFPTFHLMTLYSVQSRC